MNINLAILPRLIKSLVFNFKAFSEPDAESSWYMYVSLKCDDEICPTCKINFVNMQLKILRIVYFNMQQNCYCYIILKWSIHCGKKCKLYDISALACKPICVHVQYMIMLHVNFINFSLISLIWWVRSGLSNYWFFFSICKTQKWSILTL